MFQFTEKVVFGTIKFEENGTTGQLLKDALSILCCSVSANIFFLTFYSNKKFLIAVFVHTVYIKFKRIYNYNSTV